MTNQRLHDEFPLLVRCESSDTVVFVACPRGGRYGDVRKTLAGLLQRPFATTHIAPFEAANAQSSLLPQLQPSQTSQLLPAQQQQQQSQRVHNGIIPFNDAAQVNYSKQTPIIRAQILSLSEQGV